MSAILYIVATPIGNLDDISFRALNTLKNVDFILAEDSRITKKLILKYDIKTKVKTFNEHIENKNTDKIITDLNNNICYALVSDAGTPLISDPGYLLVSKAKKQNIKVVPIPGANAAISALSASGLVSNNFSFIGFLPNKSNQRLKAIKDFKDSKTTLIFYESPKRVLSSIKDMAYIFGNDRKACLAKELTKKFETIITSTLDEVILWLEQDIKRQKGEFVILISPNKDKTYHNYDINTVLKILLTELSPAKAAKAAAKICNADKNICYKMAINLKK